jgi:hypothetical protein
MFHFVKFIFSLINFHTNGVIQHMVFMELDVKLNYQIKRTFNLSLVIVTFVVTVCVVACLCLVLVLCLSYLCYYSVWVTLICKIVPTHYIFSTVF